MQSAIKAIASAGLAATGLWLAACHNSPEGDQNVLVDTNVPADADIEALPPDESAGTPADQLANGEDNADVADLNSTSNQD